MVIARVTIVVSIGFLIAGIRINLLNDRIRRGGASVGPLATVLVILRREPLPTGVRSAAVAVWVVEVIRRRGSGKQELMGRETGP